MQPGVCGDPRSINRRWFWIFIDSELAGTIQRFETFFSRRAPLNVETSARGHVVSLVESENRRAAARMASNSNVCGPQRRVCRVMRYVININQPLFILQYETRPSPPPQQYDARTKSVQDTTRLRRSRTCLSATTTAVRPLSSSSDFASHSSLHYYT